MPATKLTRDDVDYYNNNDYTFEKIWANNTKTDGIVYNSLDEISEALNMTKDRILYFQKRNEMQCTFSGQCILIKKKKEKKEIQKKNMTPLQLGLMKNKTIEVLELLKEQSQLKNEVVYTFDINFKDRELSDFEEDIINKKICIKSSLKTSDVEMLFSIAHIIYTNSFENVYENDECIKEKAHNLLFEKFTLPAWKTLYKYTYSFLIGIFEVKPIKTKNINADVKIITIDSLINELSN